MIRKIIFISVLAIFMLFFLGFSSQRPRVECNVKNFYVEIEPDYDTKVVTRNGSIEDAEMILVPTKLNVGKYEVRLTRKDLDMYKIEGTDYWIETKYCYEYPSWEPVTLIITSNYGFTKGKVIF